MITLQNLNEFERTLMRYTIFRLDDLTGYVHYLTLKEQLSSIMNIPATVSPKFSFIHIVSPHPPYTCDENGKYRSKAKMINTWWSPKEEYLGQLKYINKEVEKFIASILKNSKAEPIIVIQSDHGPWMQDASPENVYESRSRILNAYYIPYEWRSTFYPSITPINTFPVIFNNLFGDSIPLLKDIPLDMEGMKKYPQTAQMHLD